MFEDLLIMGGSKCVAQGMSSFGAFGAGLIGNRYRAIHRRYDGKPVVCLNDRTDCLHLNTTQLYEGRLVFDSKMDGRDMISPRLCDGMSVTKETDSDNNVVDS